MPSEVQPAVRQERTGWRDLALSNRHRRWGWDCPAVDLDFLFLEYDKGRATALVEYKHEKARTQHSIHPTYKAMIDLANRAKLPLFGCRYAADFSTFRVVALNQLARESVPEPKVMTEEEWVTLLYKLRGYDLPPGFFDDKETWV